jgi:hypothetical protein
MNLTAKPSIVARAIASGWEWPDMTEDDVNIFRLAVAQGLVGTAQRRDDGGAFVLIAWSIEAQKNAAMLAAAERKTVAAERARPKEDGPTPRVYRAPAKPSAMPTHVPYEPAHW